MPKILFLPMNKTVDVVPAVSILESALANGIELEHACGGNCACATCHIIVKSGMENLSEMQDDESDRLDTAEGLTPTSRLGCQARVYGDVIVFVPNGKQI